jgi:hypothetical protein
MAPRIKLRHLPYDRTKIKVGVLLEMLEAHATGRRKMDASQVRAAQTPGGRFGVGKPAASERGAIARCGAATPRLAQTANREAPNGRFPY